MLGLNFLTFSSSRSKPQYDCGTRPLFPPMDDLIAKAEKCVESCWDVDQLHVSTHFFQKVAIRGMIQKHYNLEETRKCTTLLEYLKNRQASKMVHH
jgi:hypothetical protein